MFLFMRVLLSLFIVLIPISALSSDLSFQSRLHYQRSLERVYYENRLWPSQNPSERPAFEDVISDEILTRKVEAYLKQSFLHEKYWKRPLTEEQLQAEIVRIVENTQRPDMLRQLFAALDNDPYVIAECLARPLLADRQIRNWFSSDRRFHGDLRKQVESCHASLTIDNVRLICPDQYEESVIIRDSSGEGEILSDKYAPAKLLSVNADEFSILVSEYPGERMISQIEDYEEAFVIRYTLAKTENSLHCGTITFPKLHYEEWFSREKGTEISIPDRRKVSYSVPEFRDVVSPPSPDNWHALLNPPSARFDHTAVWTGTEMIIWGGNGAGKLNTGGSYSPVTNTWKAITQTNAPSPRHYHTAIWTGKEMIVFGGETSGVLQNTGGHYNPVLDEWQPTSVQNAVGRENHVAVWTGTYMIVWGGDDRVQWLMSGARYIAETKTWVTTPMPDPDPPTILQGASAVWSGSEMITFGYDGVDIFSKGSRYNPTSNSWQAVSTVNSPSARFNYGLVWAGREMIVWGGSGAPSVNTGGRYDPTSDTWTETTTVNVPYRRQWHEAVWTGTEVLFWGGDYDGTQVVHYNPTSDTFTEINSTNGPPNRNFFTAVWTGTEMIIWGGKLGNGNVSDGARYNPTSHIWASTPTSIAPEARYNHGLVWTGAEMIVWGGKGGTTLNSGGIYSLITDAWQPLTTVDAPSARENLTSIWTGSDMIIWGGTETSGGLYNLISETWTPMSVTGVPLPRKENAAVWTGTEMIIWGGKMDSGAKLNSGGIYTPGGDWTETNTDGAPPGAAAPANDWTGSELIVWGGDAGSPSGYGGLYNPVTDTWTSITTDGAPTPRYYHTGAWGNSVFMVWGGYLGNYNTGGRYYPATDTWQPMTTVNAPLGSVYSQSIFTGSDFLVWGGRNNSSDLMSGGLYNPVLDRWWTMKEEPNVAGRYWHRMIWTGDEMVVWDGRPTTETGGIYFVNSTPTAAISASTSINNDQIFILGLSEILTLSGTASTSGSNPQTSTPFSDNHDSIVAYEWDLNGDAGLAKNCIGAVSGFDLVSENPDPLVDGDFSILGIDSIGDRDIWLRVTDEIGDKSCISETITILDGAAPTAIVVAPNGGESWTYSETDTNRQQHLIVWSATDNFDVSSVEVLYTTDDGGTWTSLQSFDYRPVVSSTNIPLPIPDDSSDGVASALDVPESDFLVRDIDVIVNIDHTAVGDLTISLIGPDSTEVILSANNGGSSDNFTGTTFDDQAIDVLSEWTGPFSGSFQPDGSLSDFNNKRASGTWSLKVVDNGSGETGEIVSWSLSFTYYEQTSLLWDMPTSEEAMSAGQQFPSSDCRVQVKAWDTSGNYSSDESDNNFYIIQPTSTAIKSLVIWNSERICSAYDSIDCNCSDWPSDTDCTVTTSLSNKLIELVDHNKVTGTILDLASVTETQDPYLCWDDCFDGDGCQQNPVCNDTDPLNPDAQERTNLLATAIRSYIMDQVTLTYTNTEYIIFVGDDRQIPFYRMVDGTTIYPENSYIAEVGLEIDTTIGSSIAANRILTDNFYSELSPESSGLASPHDTVYLNDFALGRLVETPSQIESVIATFLSQDGQLTATPDSSDHRVLVTGFDFLHDSAFKIKNSYVDSGYTETQDLHCLLDKPTGADSDWCTNLAYKPSDLQSQLFSSNTAELINVNTHANHFAFAASIEETSGNSLLCTDSSYASGCSPSDMSASQDLSGAVLYTSGCHSGLTVPESASKHLDLPEMMAMKKIVAYIGNTGYGWGLRRGRGLTEKLMMFMTDALLENNSITIGQALAGAKRKYFLREKRYDVFDEKVMHELSLFGIPNYLIVTSTTKESESKELPLPDGPDAGCSDGICLEKSLKRSDDSKALPGGVTELELNFTFGAGTYQNVATDDGNYYELNGESSGEVGDAIQPHFVYNSYLTGTNAHGVLFTGGTATEDDSFDPVVAIPRSTNAETSEGVLPITNTWVPGMRISFGTTGGSAQKAIGEIGYTNMIVHTGYFESASSKERLFDTMQFVIYYSSSGDVSLPVITDPDPGTFHSVSDMTANFSVTVTDNIGVFRVLVTYNDIAASSWSSLDLVKKAGTSVWEGSLDLPGNITYFVQAVDTDGNVGIPSTTGDDLNGDLVPYGSQWTGPKLYSISLPDADSDGMPDAYENLHSCLSVAVADAGSKTHTCQDGPDSSIDPDQDCRSNIQEYIDGTDPCSGDTDGGGDNDGSELNNGRAVLDLTDDKHITIQIIDSSPDILVDWNDTLGDGDNALISGYYFVYAGANPSFSPADLKYGPLGDTVSSQLDPSPACNPCYYKVWNYELNTLPPSPDAVVPGTGSTAGGETVNIYGQNFVNLSTVTFCDVPASDVVWHNESWIEAVTPANGAGLCDIVVISPNNQSGILIDGFQYVSP